jgi:hypothetical protein
MIVAWLSTVKFTEKFRDCEQQGAQGIANQALASRPPIIDLI